MSELVGAIPDELREQPEIPEVVVSLGDTFPLFPAEVTRVKPKMVVEEGTTGLRSKITVIEPDKGYSLPLSIYGVVAPDGMFSIEVETRALGQDLLTKKGRLRKRGVTPFIASLRLEISLPNTNKEELVPEINKKVNGISFFLPNALQGASENEVRSIQGRIFSITAERL